MASREGAIFDATKPWSPLSVPASSTALLLMDYQGLTMSFVGEDSPRLLDATIKMRDWALARGMAVYHCLVDLSLQASPEPYLKMAARWPVYQGMIKSAPELGLEVEQLSVPQASETEKTVGRQAGYVSALESKGLLDELRSKGIRSLILGGISTSGCVLSTARASTDGGFIVTVAEDICFDPVPGMHKLLVEHALPATAHVATAGDIRAAFDS